MRVLHLLRGVIHVRLHDVVGVSCLISLWGAPIICTRLLFFMFAAIFYFSYMSLLLWWFWCLFFWLVSLSFCYYLLSDGQVWTFSPRTLTNFLTIWAAILPVPWVLQQRVFDLLLFQALRVSCPILPSVVPRVPQLLVKESSALCSWSLEISRRASLTQCGSPPHFYFSFFCFCF